jgi:hypothetical protein
VIRRFFEKLGIMSPVVLTETNFLVTVFVMSEGTAQGTPRPLQVFKRMLPFSINMKDRYSVGPEPWVAAEVYHIIRRGYTHTLSDGTKVTHAPHTIYKVTSKEMQ